MNCIETELDGVLVLEPKVYGDERGYFFESYSKRVYDDLIADTVFVQDNESLSKYGVIRGLHFQYPPHEQAKLVRVVQGEVLDVAVDIRKGSPNFGKFVSVKLSGTNKRQIFIPKGFAHGFAVLSESVILQYKCDSFYAPESEGTIRWNDPDIGIKWPIDARDVLVSEKDEKAPFLRELF